MIKRLKRLDSKLAVVFVLIGLVPLIIAGCLAIVSAKRSLREQSAHHLQAVADAKTDRIESYLFERMADGTVLSQSTTLFGDMERLRGAFHQQGISSPEYAAVAAATRLHFDRYVQAYGYQNLLLTDAEGNVLFSLVQSPETGTNLRTGPRRAGALAKALDNITTLLTTGITDWDTNDLIDADGRAFVAAPIFERGRLTGMVALEINNRELFRIVQDDSGLGETGDTVVGRLDGGSILFMAPSRHDVGAAFRRRLPINSSHGLPLQEAVRGSNGLGQALDYRGEDTLAVWKYLPSFRWGMVVKMDSKEAFAPVRALQKLAVILALVVGVVVALLAPLVARSLSAPIRVLAQITRAFSAGDLTRRATIVSHDEVGDLAAAFNQMADTIQQQLGELRHAKDGLEQRVQERTAELARTNESLRESDEKFSQLADNATDVFWMVSADRRRILYASPAYERIYGRSVASLYANPHQWMDAILPEDREHVSAAIGALGDNESSGNIEYRITRPDGSIRWINDRGFQVRDGAGKVFRIGGIAQDISERKQVEASRDRLAAILEATTDLVSIADPAGHLLYLNRAGRNLLGVDLREEVTATSIADFLPNAASHPILTEGIPTAVRTGSWSGETVLLSRRGLEIPTSQVILVHKTSAGEVEFLSTIMRDITERKKSDAALEESNRQLRDASRQAGMAEVATSVLHNVGNVLNSVNVSATLASEKIRRSCSSDVTRIAELFEQHRDDLPGFLASPQGTKLPPFLKSLSQHLGEEQQAVLTELESLRAHIEHIKEIVGMQQAHARLAGVTEQLPAASLVEDALRLNAGTLGHHGVELVRDFGETRSLTVDKHKALQILVNLIRNAAQAMDAPDAPGKRMTLCIGDDGAGFLSLSVGDEGGGISAENMQRIFEHGFTTRKDGHGFGLHSAALAAREMGGSLTAHSAGPGQGAVFSLALPFRPHSFS